MGNSSISVQQVLDWAKAKGMPVPTDQPGSYGTDLAIKAGNDVMSDLVAERFNWKWNHATAPPFYTNSYQQDYPQIGLSDIGWLESADRVDINNTSYPKPLRQMTAVKQLSRTSDSFVPSNQICWMYNKDLAFGVWPGPGQVYSPLVAAQIQQNPLMSMIDVNRNLLVVTTFGTTGSVAPVLPVNSAEGLTVNDGSVVWTVVSKVGQGFRVYPLPGASGPVWQITPYYQVKLAPLVSLQSFLDPIPDDFERIFQVGYELYCKQSSPNPQDRAEGLKLYPLWLQGLMDAKKQGDRELNAYSMLPATSPVANTYDYIRNPQDPSQPY